MFDTWLRYVATLRIILESEVLQMNSKLAATGLSSHVVKPVPRGLLITNAILVEVLGSAARPDTASNIVNVLVQEALSVNPLRGCLLRQGVAATFCELLLGLFDR